MDLVVTCPMGRWPEWLAEGDLAGVDQPAIWEEENVYGWCFGPGSSRPDIEPGDRVYVVAHGRLRGFAPLVEISEEPERFGGQPGGFALVRHGGAQAVTLPVGVRGFQGYRYRWWRRDAEIPFPDWREP